MQDVRGTIRVISPATAPKLNIYGAALSVLSSSNGAPVVIGEQTVPPGYGVPLHLHASDGESFYVLEGEFTLVSAGGELTVHAGSFVEIPRGLPYRFCNDTDGPARLLVMLLPDVQAAEIFQHADGTGSARQPMEEEIGPAQHIVDRSGSPVATQWLRDPISHPQLTGMSVTELADLPFEPWRFSKD